MGSLLCLTRYSLGFYLLTGFYFIMGVAGESESEKPCLLASLKANKKAFLSLCDRFRIIRTTLSSPGPLDIPSAPLSPLHH